MPFHPQKTASIPLMAQCQQIDNPLPLNLHSPIDLSLRLAESSGPANIDAENKVAGVDIELQMADSSTQTYTIENAGVDTFIGFTSLEAFNSIIVAPHDLAIWNDDFGAAEDLFLSADHLYAGSASPVPVPAAVWLLGSGLLGLVGLRRKRSE